jgi:putative PIN family toxin of toxin-antitoxin system
MAGEARPAEQDIVTRAVFDCVILLQAAGRLAGPAAACLQAVRNGRLELFLSPDILAEVRDVLTRPKTLRKFPALTPKAVDVFLTDIATHATMLPTVPKVFTLARDPKDEPYVDLAAATQARYLVSRDKDLLDLMGDDAFRQQFPGLTVIDPVGLLRELATEHPKTKPDHRIGEDEAREGNEAE